MRRLVSITVFAVLIALPALAQMRGGAHFGGVSVGHGFVGHGPALTARGSSFGPAVRGGVRFGTFGGFGSPFFFPGRFHHHPRFFFGASFFFPGYYWPYYSYYTYPYPVTYSSPSYDYSTASSYELEMTRELDRLTAEVQQLRELQQQQAYANAPANAPKADNKQEANRPTVLVFRDKHIQEVQNYAIVGETLWVFNEQRATRIPIAQLDIPATTKLNEERGIEFRAPAR